MFLLWNFGVAVLLSVLWTASEAIRRLYFHPLAHIPGPRLAALTWWYEFYFDVVQPGQYVFKIQELHTRYGMSCSASCVSPTDDCRPNHPYYPR